MMNKKVIPIMEFSREQNLKIFLKIGFAPCVV